MKIKDLEKRCENCKMLDFCIEPCGDCEKYFDCIEQCEDASDEEICLRTDPRIGELTEDEYIALADKICKSNKKDILEEVVKIIEGKGNKN